MKLSTDMVDLDSTEEGASYPCGVNVKDLDTWRPSGELCKCGETWAMHLGMLCPEDGTFNSTGLIVWYDGTLHAKGISTEDEQAFLTLAAALLGAA